VQLALRRYNQKRLQPQLPLPTETMKKTSAVRALVLDESPLVIDPPRLLVELEPARDVFLRNLKDLIRPQQLPRLRLSSWPGQFWPDVFIDRRAPWRAFAQSLGLHILVVSAVIGATELWMQPARVLDKPTFSSSDVLIYSASDYLPPLNTGRTSRRKAPKGEPARAAQAILSVPAEADNHSQTIVTPPSVKLDHDAKLPNIVAWDKPAPAAPLSATSSPALRLPTLDAAPVAPAPDVKLEKSRRAALTDDAVIAPPPDVQLHSGRLGTLDIGHTEIVAPAPKLSLAEQRSPSRSLSSLDSASSVVAPPPTFSGTSTHSSGRLIALNAQPGAPVAPPAGNRRGSFALAPDGKASPAGIPQSNSGNDRAASASGKEVRGLPSGLQVASGSRASSKSSGNSTATPRLMADASAPRVSTNGHQTPAVLADNPTELDREVFGARRSYSMTLNLPNLNSAGGSWIIHFAELKSDGGDSGKASQLFAPVAVHKVDPGYPLELMRHNVAGTEIVYAVIAADGSVGSVRVINSVDDRLDAYAKSAVSHWQFLPATKDGVATPVEAVFLIPFRPVHNASNF